jgi:sulfide:quinone oxidoreductase
MTHHDVLVVGGGNAGVSLAARLLRDGVEGVAVAEPQGVHRYRPLLNYVGVGQASMATLERRAGDVMPEGATWVRERVVAVDPASSSVSTASGGTFTWSTLVLCPGLEEDWDATPGLAEAYAQGWAGSTFVIGSVEHVWARLAPLSTGRVVFTVPPEPAPCGATAFKPLLMACDHWRRAGVLEDLDVQLVIPGPTPLGIERADSVLERTLARYGVTVLRSSRVSALSDHQVTVECPDGPKVLTDVAYAHVVPEYRAPRWIGASGLAGPTATGLVDVDPLTLRHREHPTIWSLGDVADLRTRPSGGALRKQVDVLAHNLLAADAGAMRRYDGYTVVPITVSRRRLMLVEVDRDGTPSPSVAFPDLVRPRRSTWWFDRHVLPTTYFRRILRGRV